MPLVEIKLLEDVFSEPDQRKLSGRGLRTEDAHKLIALPHPA